MAWAPCELSTGPLGRPFPKLSDRRPTGKPPSGSSLYPLSEGIEAGIPTGRAARRRAGPLVVPPRLCEKRSALQRPRLLIRACSDPIDRVRTARRGLRPHERGHDKRRMRNPGWRAVASDGWAVDAESQPGAFCNDTALVGSPGRPPKLRDRDNLRSRPPRVIVGGFERTESVCFPVIAIKEQR